MFLVDGGVAIRTGPDFGKRILAILLVVLLGVGCAFTTHAEEYDDTIATMQQQEAETQATISNLEKQTKETQDAISELQGQKSQTQSNISSLQNQSSQLQSTINGYSSKLSDLNDEISVTESALAEVSSEIIELDNELQQARQQEKERYELLKKRMPNTLIQMLLRASNTVGYSNNNIYPNTNAKNATIA